MALPSAFRRMLRISASPYLPEGWAVRGTGLALQAADGCWGQIVFSGASREEPTPRSHVARIEDEFVREWPVLRLSLTAGTCAPYLMRTVNELDPSRPPTPNFVAAHVQICFDVRVVFATAASQSPTPFNIPERQTLEPYYLDPQTAREWLGDSLAKLVPATQALASNEAIYNHLRDQSASFNLRYAYLLGRHLGLYDDLPRLAERAREACEDERRRFRQREWEYSDRQKTYPQDWSHDRFMRFVETTPP